MFLLNMQSKVPIYQQIQEQIMRFIKAGVLNPGDKLPSVRQLAKDNGINPNTVAKAYAELEALGYVHNVAKKGVYISEIHEDESKTKNVIAVLKALKGSGISKKEIIDAVNELYQEDE